MAPNNSWSLVLDLSGVRPFDPFEPPEPPPRPRQRRIPRATPRRCQRRPRGARALRHRSRLAKAAEGDDPPPLRRFRLGTPPAARTTAEARP